MERSRGYHALSRTSGHSLGRSNLSAAGRTTGRERGDRGGEAGHGKGKKKASKYKMDFNAYVTKKNMAQGLVDIALLTTNATQLKYLLHSGAPPLDANLSTYPFDGAFPWRFYIYWANMSFIGLSICLQVVVGLLLLLNSRHEGMRYNRRENCRAESCNNYILIGVFFITLVNVFIGVFLGYEGSQLHP